MRKAGIDNEQYKSHSTRASATSCASKRHFPENDIHLYGNKLVVGLVGPRRLPLIQRFYNKPVEPGTSFTSTILDH